MKTTEIGSLIVAIIALLAAVGGAYVTVATKTDASTVEHIVELKSSDKFGEILRRLESIDRRLDRLEHTP